MNNFFSVLKNRFSSIPIMWQLSGLLIGQALLILLVMYFFSWKSNLALLEEASHELLLKSESQISNKLTNFLDSALENNQYNLLFARQNNFSNLSEYWKKIFINEVLRSKDITNVAVAYPSGDYFGIDRRDSGQLIHQAAKISTVRELVSNKTDPSGVLGEEVSRATHYDPRTRPWYIVAITNRAQCWSDVYKHYADDTLQLAASLPIYDSANSLQAVLVSAVRLSQISQYLKTNKISADSQTIVVDSKGFLVASTSDTPLYHTETGSTKRIEPRNSDDPLIKIMGGFLGVASGTVRHARYGEKEFHVNVTNFNHPLGLSWKIISAVPTERHLGSLTKRLEHLQVTIGLLLLLSLLCSYWMGRRLVRPLLSLNQAVNDFSRGLFTFKPLQRTDEIGALTTSFANMAKDNLKLSLDLQAKINELEKAFCAIGNSELKFRTIFNGTSDAIFVRSFTESGGVGPFLEVNDVACSRLGYSREELLKMSTEDINYSESCDCLENIRNKIAEQGQAIFEATHLTKDGRLIPVEISSHQFQLDGNPVILSVARDITARKQAEASLAEEKKFIDQALDSISDIFFAFDLNGRFLRWNRILALITGYNNEEIATMNPLDYFRGEDVERISTAIHKTVETGSVVVEACLVTKHGAKQIPFEFRSSLLRNHYGDPVAICGFGRDITDRIQSENLILKLSQAVEQSPVSLVITDTKGEIEFVNSKFTELTGYSFKEATGQNPRILRSGQTPPEVYQKLWTTISSGNVWEGEFLNRSKDGTLFWEHATIAPLRDIKGEITHYLAIKEDITEKKSIMNQLLQSQKLEAVGKLAGGIAHDFNNILSIIRGYAYLMKLKSGSGLDQTENIEKIELASARGAELTQSLLAFSRKQVLNLRQQNLNPLLSNTSTFIMRLIGENIELSLSMKDDPLMVYIDPGQIEQVLLNLTTNARDAMPNGGTLHFSSAAVIIDEYFIRTHGFGHAGNYAIISISGSGCGMDEQTMKQIFEPFFTTKGVGEGTGLGMSMAMGIVKQHDGFITVRSTVGKGTTFEIYLPLMVNAIDTPEPVQFDSCLPEHGEGTILVAEDEPFMRDYMGKLLTTIGYTVVFAIDGQEAVDTFAQMKDEIQLVIFDMVMPRKSGKEAWNEIRQIDGSIKVIYVSGYSEDFIKRRGEFSPDEVLIRKPILPQELLGLVKDMIRTK